MSCPNATAPIDISLSSITGKCDYKCSYEKYVIFKHTRFLVCEVYFVPGKIHANGQWSS